MRTKILALTIIAAAILSGCDDGHQYDDVRPYMQPGSGPQPVASAPAEVEAERDPVKPKDASLDYMQMPRDPLVADDPLSISKDTFAEPTDDTPPADPLATTDVVMPTKHSHWLRGAISGATVSVSVNHVKVGDFAATIDKDITMRCRKGYNAVTFTYTPFEKSAFATVDVLESEHNPPIAPLASFDSTVDAIPDASALDTDKPTTKTFQFVAE